MSTISLCLFKKIRDALEVLDQLGLTATYSRRHLGQGTANLCYAFNNMFLEFIWLENEAECKSERIKRTALFERSQWIKKKTCPFGIAYRFDTEDLEIEVPHWDFKPEYLPQDGKIKVTEDSVNPMNPMVFKALSVSPPAKWAQEKQGLLQSPSGLKEVAQIRFSTPQDYELSASLVELSKKAKMLSFHKSASSAWEVEFELTGDSAQSSAVLCFPNLKNSRIPGKAK